MAQPETKTVTDMMGRTVVIPYNVTSVATAFGTAPPIISYVMAIGEADTIANGLSENFATDDRHEYVYVFAPQLATAPQAEDIESLIKLNPNLVLVSDTPTLDDVESKTNIPVIFVNTSDNNGAMLLMGEIFNKQDKAAEYVQYYDANLAEINALFASVPENQRPKVLAFRTTMELSTSSGDWIKAAGGIPVFNKSETTGSRYQFDAEQLLKWNPDVILGRKETIIEISNDSRFSEIGAIKNHRLYVVPTGAHDWSLSTSEKPLMLEWSASKFYPELIPEDKMINDAIDFYKEFYGVTLTRDQVQEIFSGYTPTDPSILKIISEYMTGNMT